MARLADCNEPTTNTITLATTTNAISDPTSPSPSSSEKGTPTKTYQAVSAESTTDNSPTHTPPMNVEAITARKYVGNCVPYTNGLIATRTNVAMATVATINRYASTGPARRQDRPPSPLSLQGRSVSHAPNLVEPASGQYAL